jgi:hypothetical protein
MSLCHTVSHSGSHLLTHSLIHSLLIHSFTRKVQPPRSAPRMLQITRKVVTRLVLVLVVPSWICCVIRLLVRGSCRCCESEWVSEWVVSEWAVVGRGGHGERGILLGAESRPVICSLLSTRKQAWSEEQNVSNPASRPPTAAHWRLFSPMYDCLRSLMLSTTCTRPRPHEAQTSA